MSKVLVLGGTGRLSKDVVSALLTQKHIVHCINRRSDERKLFVNAACRNIVTDIRDAEFISSAIADEQYDAVIDFISYCPEHLNHKLEMLKGHYTQYIFISSATIYKPSSKLHREETAKLDNTKWPYSRGKIECEAFLQDYFAKNEIGFYTIVRPYVTYGNTRIPYPIVPIDNRCEWSYVRRILLNETLPILRLQNIVTLTHTSFFAAVLACLVENEKAYNDAFHITDKTSCRWEDVVDLCIDISGSKSKKCYFESGEFVGHFPEYEDVLSCDKGNTWLFDNSKVLSLVNRDIPHISLEQGLTEMLSYYREYGDSCMRDLEWERKINQICK